MRDSRRQKRQIAITKEVLVRVQKGKIASSIRESIDAEVNEQKKAKVKMKDFQVINRSGGIHRSEAEKTSHKRSWTEVQEEMQDMRTKETMESSWEKRRRKKMERWMAPPPGPPKENNNKRQAEAESDMRGRRARWESPPTIPPDNL